MYKKVIMQESSIRTNNCVEGERIEHKVARMLTNKEVIRDGAPLIYTERKDGVKASYDPRTDRFEVAIEAMTKVDKSYKARRISPEKVEKTDGKTEPIQGKPEGGTEL